jgi:uncharacterized membrane protein YecN with MAPEG domain
MIPATLWTAIATLAIGLFYFYTTMLVGKMRGRHKILAPATSGHPEFDRAFRVQLNTLEQMGLFLPFLWVAAFYPVRWDWLAPLMGFVWLVGRILYMQGYMTEPAKRAFGGVIAAIATLVVFVTAVSGVGRAILALR